MSCAVILSSGSYRRQPLKNDTKFLDRRSSAARSGGMNTDMGSFLENRGTDRNASRNGGGAAESPPGPPPPPPPMLPRLLLLLPTEKAPEKRLPVLGAPQLLLLQLLPLTAPSANSPLLRLPPPPLTLLWKELICGHTSFTRFQYRLFLGI